MKLLLGIKKKTNKLKRILKDNEIIQHNNNNENDHNEI